MKADDFAKEFLALSEADRMKVMKKILPVFCQGMTGTPERMREMFALLTEECGGPMANMISMMGMMMGRRRGGCCG